MNNNSLQFNSIPSPLTNSLSQHSKDEPGSLCGEELTTTCIWFIVLFIYFLLVGLSNFIYIYMNSAKKAQSFFALLPFGAIFLHFSNKKNNDDEDN